MNYRTVLRRIHAELAQEQAAEKSTTLYIRVKPEGNEHWRDTLVAVLIGSNNAQAQYKIDASKYFFVDKGNVKYLWRLVFRGADVPAGLAFFAHCVLGVANQNVKELSSFPLSEGSSTPSTQHAES